MKRFLSVMLVAVMVITMLPSAIFAASSAPLELLASINEDEATIKLNTTEAFEMSALDFTVNIPEGCTIAAITKGADYASIGAGEPSIDQNNVCILASQFNVATIVPAGKEMMVITVDTSNATGNTLNFSIEVTAAADFNDNTHNWEGALVTSNDVTVGSAVDGYTAALSTTAANNEVVSEGNITVNVGVSHSADTVFNAGEIKLGYDGTKLTPDTDYIANTLKLNYEIENEGAVNAVLIIEDFGEDKTMSSSTPYTYGIPFAASEVNAETETTITLTSAAFVHKDNANESDLVAATKTPESLTVTIKPATVKVTLKNSETGETKEVTVNKEEDYTFAPDDTANYTYSEVSATVDGKTVSITNNGNGTWTIAGADVTGDIEITYTKSGNVYNVSVSGDDAAKIGLPDGKRPTYGEDYIFTVPENTPATSVSDGYTYTVTVTVKGSDYEPEVDGLNYKIPGTDITGDVVITIATETHPATGVPQVSVVISGSTDVKVNGKNSDVVSKGDEVTLTLTPETGYTYSVVVGSGDPVTFTNNEYTFAVDTDVTVYVTKTLDVSTVAVYEYVTMDGIGSAWLVTFDPTLSGKTPTYDENLNDDTDGVDMFWSEKYDAYCWLVIAESLNVEDVKTAISARTLNGESDKAPEVDYGMDINGTNVTDAADAQLVWNMYNAMYGDFTSVTMARFLAADQNAVSTDNITWKLTVEDAQVIIAAILAGNATI